MELLAEADVVVVGSGSAGAVAAVAAARNGARTLLLERNAFLGGTSTAVLDTFYGFYTPGRRSLKVVGGIADEVVAGLRGFGMCFERPNTYGAGAGVTYHPDYLKVVWERLVEGAGVNLLLNVWVQDARLTGDRVRSLVVATRKGLCEVRGAVFVDASGDAELCFYSGAPFEQAGEQEPAQMLTPTFRMANVDMERRRQVSKAEFHREMARAAESGEYDLPRREGSDHATPLRGVTHANMTRVESFALRGGKAVNASDPVLLTAAEIEGRRQALEYVRFLRDRIPGYEEAELAAFGAQIGVRETRRICGLYRLTREDVLSARRFDDQIGLCGAPIEDHHRGTDTRWAYLPEGESVGIPYRTLLPRKVANLLAAGRCFSATHDAHASVRSMAQCMAMGQAAGTAAALAAKRRIAPAELSGDDLRRVLREQGAVLETPAAPEPAAR